MSSKNLIIESFYVISSLGILIGSLTLWAFLLNFAMPHPNTLQLFIFGLIAAVTSFGIMMIYCLHLLYNVPFVREVYTEKNTKSSHKNRNVTRKHG